LAVDDEEKWNNYCDYGIGEARGNGYTLSSEAVAKNDLELLKWLYSLGCSFCDILNGELVDLLCEHVAEMGLLSVLRWVNSCHDHLPTKLYQRWGREGGSSVHTAMARRAGACMELLQRCV
jgi:hypothetical protein